jgi:hypothetical protein
VPPLPYEDRIASGPNDGSEVRAGHEPEAALLEYLSMYYRLGRAGKALDRFGVVDFATTIAPGVRDVLLTGKVYEAAYRNKRGKNHRRYDAIVLDAPPTGRIAQFLNVNSELAGLAKVGPIRSQADSIMTLLRSPRTAVHDHRPRGHASARPRTASPLHAAKLPVGGVVVNLVRGNELDEARDRRSTTASPAGRSRRTSGGAASSRPTPGSTGCSPRPASTPSGVTSRTSSASASTSST